MVKTFFIKLGFYVIPNM